MRSTVSVVSTVLNEGISITGLLDSLKLQSRRPDEVIFVDGGSRDDTLEILERYAAQGELPMRILSCPGTNISQGRNAGIAAAQGAIIAVTDAGVRLAPDWLAELTRPFDQDPDAHAVAGFFAADPQSPFEIAMGATVLPMLSDLKPLAFLPSSRSVAFRKTAWEAVGGYPEWLDYCEDIILDLELRRHYGPFLFAPRALVHFRPRSSMRSFFLQYYRYARGDGKANLWPKRHTIRYLTYMLVLPLLIVLSCWHSAWWTLGFVIGGAAYTATPYRHLTRMIRGLPLGQKIHAAAMVPCIRLVGDVAKMLGYPVGWMWRLRHRREISR